MNSQEAKNNIRRLLQHQSRIDTPLGVLEILGEIGEGANALVFEAQWGGEVAVKILAEDVSSGDSTRYKRFLTEFRELIKLSHTGTVVNMYYFGTVDAGSGRFPYAIMELCSGTLKTWLEDNPVQGWQDLQPVLERILQCVKIVHDRNIVHRDIKPENILVNGEGRLALGDFGIAWFDPNHYKRLAQTRRGERLANWKFSAPEQFQSPPAEPEPAMDLYAVGQIVQWIVTGNVHRGTGRRALRAVDSSLSPLDPVVDAMLQDEPERRPVSVQETVKLIKRSFESQSLRKSAEQAREWIFKVVNRFEDALLDSFPGRRGIFKETDPVKIERLMRNLADIPEELGDHALWWSRGSANQQIERIRNLGDATWLIHNQECRIEEVWVNMISGDSARKYVVLCIDPMPSFGLYGTRHSSDMEVAARFEDGYVTIEELQDGRAEIDGEVVRLDDKAEDRLRSMVADLMFVGSQFNTVIWPGDQMQNDRVVGEVYRELKSRGTINSSLLEPLTTLDKHKEIIWWS